jgi:hypothetical protein
VTINRSKSKLLVASTNAATSGGSEIGATDEVGGLGI